MIAFARRVEYPGTLFHLTARGFDQQTIVNDETDRADFSIRLGQEILPKRWCSAKSSNDPTSFPRGVKNHTGQCLEAVVFVAPIL